jgi:hypothetical protein
MVEEKNIYGDGDNNGRRDEVPDDNQVDKNEKLRGKVPETRLVNHHYDIKVCIS